MKKIWLKLGVVSFGLVLLSGCVGPRFAAPEDEVRYLAEQHLAALLARDFEKAHSFLGPGERSTVSVRQYSAKWAGTQWWKDAQIHNVSCLESALHGEVTECIVTTKLRFMGPKAIPGGVLTSLKAKWVPVDGKWYLYSKAVL